MLFAIHFLLFLFISQKPWNDEWLRYRIHGPGSHGSRSHGSRVMDLAAVDLGVLTKDLGVMANNLGAMDLGAMSRELGAVDLGVLDSDYLPLKLFIYNINEHGWPEACVVSSIK